MRRVCTQHVEWHTLTYLVLTCRKTPKINTQHVRWLCKLFLTVGAAERALRLSIVFVFVAQRCPMCYGANLGLGISHFRLRYGDFDSHIKSNHHSGNKLISQTCSISRSKHATCDTMAVSGPCRSKCTYTCRQSGPVCHHIQHAISLICQLLNDNKNWTWSSSVTIARLRLFAMRKWLNGR